MSNTAISLLAGAVTIGFLHTAAGPDHYVPFVAMSRAGRWSLTKTIVVTLLCGVGHVLSSAIIGLIGVALGWGLPLLQTIEGKRGDWAGWALLGFGMAYCVWGIRRAIRNRPHTHYHRHADGKLHRHEHVHQDDHLHVHEGKQRLWPLPIIVGETSVTAKPADTAPHKTSLTPWILFTIFIFGPCEALIPLVMFAAAKGTLWTVSWVTLLFGAATIVTMTSIVIALCLGMSRIRTAWLERYNHAVAGLVILGCGIAVKIGF